MYLCVCVCQAHEYRQPQRPEDDIGVPGAGIIGGCEAPDVGSGRQTPNSGPLQEQPVLLTAEIFSILNTDPCLARQSNAGEAEAGN